MTMTLADNVDNEDEDENDEDGAEDGIGIMAMVITAKALSTII